MNVTKRTQSRVAESYAGSAKSRPETKTLDSTLSGLLTRSENLSRSADFPDSCSLLWGARPPPINSWPRRNQTTVNKTVQIWKRCGPEVKGHPLPSEVNLKGRQRGSKMEKRWGSKEGERSTHTHTDRQTEPEDRMGSFAEGQLVGRQAVAAWGQPVICWSWWKIWSQMRSPLGWTWTWLCVLVRTAMIKYHWLGGLRTTEMYV